MGLTGRSARKKAKRQAERDRAFAKFRQGLTEKFRKRFMSDQRRRREFMFGGVVAQYRTDQQNAERADFDIKSRELELLCINQQTGSATSSFSDLVIV